MVNMVSFGATLKNAIKKASLTQEEFANKIGISISALKTYMKGDRIPDISIFDEMCIALDCDYDYLMGKIEVSRKDVADVMNVTGLSDLAIRALKSRKLFIDNIYEGKEGNLLYELQSINMLIEDMGYINEDNPKTSFINLFTKYRMFLFNEINDLYYMTDHKGKIEPLKITKTAEGGNFISSDKLPFKASMLENMFLMAIQDRLKELKKEGESDGNHNTQEE